LDGKHELAIKLWRSAVSKNDSDIFGYFGQFELGRHLMPGPERTLWLQRSIERFDRSQFIYYAKQARKELNRPKEEVELILRKSVTNYWIGPLAVGTILTVAIVVVKWWKTK